MAKKKGSRKKKRSSLPPLSPDQSERLKIALEAPERIDTSDVRASLPDAAVAAAFLERLPAGGPALVPVLTAVRDAFPEKSVRKAARKAAFRFEQQGTDVPPSPSSEAPVLRFQGTPEQGRPFAFLTPTDGIGVRGVLLALPKAPKGIELGAALVSDEAGILQYTGGAFSKKKAALARDDFLEGFEHVVPASPEHALSVLEQAQRAKPDAPGTAAYLRARPWLLDRITPAKEPPAGTLIPVEGEDGRVFTESMAVRLLGHEILTSWMVDPREAQSLAEDIREAENSPIHLSEDQQDRRIDEIKRAWIPDHFSGDRRERLRLRLEETAYVLHHLGDPELARLARIAARSLEAPESLFDAHPLLRLMTERTLLLFHRGLEDAGFPEETGGEAAPDTDEKPSGIIIP